MKILVAEDDDAVRLIVRKHLIDWHYEVEEVTTGRAALDALLRSQDPPALAILDWMMPEIEGPEICRMMRSRPDAPFVYLILLSARDDTKDVVDGLDAGADDYLVKPFHPEELRSRIRAGERIIGLQRNLREANANLRQLALTDEVTKQLNRPAIMERYGEELLRASRQGTSLTVVMVDIDHFKKVNDSHGHAAGDAALHEFAGRLRTQLRIYDAVGRYGGEEFLLLMPAMPADVVSDVLERIRASVCDSPISVGETTIPLTASFGAAWLGPGVSPNEEDLLRLADRMLYRAKENGRNRIEIASYEQKVETSAPALG